MLMQVVAHVQHQMKNLDEKGNKFSKFFKFLPNEKKYIYMSRMSYLLLLEKKLIFHCAAKVNVKYHKLLAVKF